MTRKTLAALAAVATVATSAATAHADRLTALVRDGDSACFTRQFTGAAREAGQRLRSLTLAVTRADRLRPDDPAVAEIRVTFQRTDRPGTFVYRAICADEIPGGAGCLGNLPPSSPHEASEASVVIRPGARQALLSLASSLAVVPRNAADPEVVVLPFGAADGRLTLTRAPLAACGLSDPSARL